jgi:hypothetical protein
MNAPANPIAAGQLHLVCVKCTRETTIAATARAVAEAKEKGWVWDGGGVICPRCPASRRTRGGDVGSGRRADGERVTGELVSEMPAAASAGSEASQIGSQSERPEA